MSNYRLLADSEHRIAEIYHYTFEQWGEAQADRYYHGLLDAFEAIAAHTVPWRKIPAEFGVDGFLCRYERHLIYWRTMGDGALAIATILHERMDQRDVLKAAFES